MIILKELERLSKYLQGSRIYFNPFYYADSVRFLHLSPLIVDRTIMYITNKTPGIDNSKIQAFQDEGFLIPASISEKTLPTNFQSKKCILRTNLFDEKLFNKDYKDSIQEDQDDENLKEVIKAQIQTDARGELNSVVDSFSFCANWDLLMMQTLNLPMYAPTQFKSALFYKLEKMGNQIYFPKRTKYPLEISSFLKAINVIFPLDLSVDQIKDFRRDRAAIGFRNWLEKKLTNVEERDSNTILTHLVQQFNELSKSYETKTEVISATLGGLIGTLAEFIIEGTAETGIGTTLGTVSGYGLSKYLRSLWKWKGRNRWVFLLTDFKKKGFL